MSVDVKGDEIESSVLQLQHLLQLDLGVVGPVALRSVVATCTRQVLRGLKELTWAAA